MALPELTAEQRREYLERAAAARKARADLRKKLKEGTVSFLDVMKRADDPTVARMKVLTLLESLPGYGKARAQAVLDQVGIAQTRKVQGLGSRQRAELIDLLS
ncbi:MAG: integration host factor [Coriobacteriia bacterium]|nr:integration host factor [Coriobacteriia bacterium]